MSSSLVRKTSPGHVSRLLGYRNNHRNPPSSRRQSATGDLKLSPPEFLPTQANLKSPDDLFDLVLQRSSQATEAVNEALGGETDKALRAVILDLCMISGILYYLNQMLRDSRTEREWAKTIEVLCAQPGPLRRFAIDMELVVNTYTFKTKLSRLLKPPAERKTLSETTAIIERYKAIFVLALKNDPL